MTRLNKLLIAGAIDCLERLDSKMSDLFRVGCARMLIVGRHCFPSGIQYPHAISLDFECFMTL